MNIVRDGITLPLLALLRECRTGTVVASFPATDADEIMLVTDQGKLIRTFAL